MENLPNNLTNKALSELNQVLSFVTQNDPRSDFYIRKFAKQISLPLTSYEDLAALPLLYKEEIARLEPARNSYSRPEEIVSFGISSGTTTRNMPTIMPHADFYEESFRIGNFGIPGHEITKQDRLMILLPPTSGKLQWLLNYPQKPCAFNLGDPKNIQLSAKLAKEIGITALVTTPTILYFFIEELGKIDFELNNLRWINLTGEFATSSKMKFFRESLPNCFFNQTYGSSEFGGGGIGYRCPQLASQEQNLFHPLPKVLIEILDDSDKPAKNDEPGKIVLTALEPRAFPLIRFQSNDFGVLKASNCACGNKVVLSLGGRADFDVLKFHGVVLRADAISESLREIQPLLEPIFEMHVYEETTPNGIKPRLELRISLKKEGSETPEMIGLFEESVSSLLRLSPVSTLKELVEKKIFLPLEIKIEKNWGEPQGKSRHIYSHLD